MAGSVCNLGLLYMYLSFTYETFRCNYERTIFVDESVFNLHLQTSTRANVTVPMRRSVSLIASIGIAPLYHTKIIDKTTVNSNIFSKYLRELCTNLGEVHQCMYLHVCMCTAQVIYKKLQRNLGTNPISFHHIRRCLSNWMYLF